MERKKWYITWTQSESFGCRGHLILDFPLFAFGLVQAFTFFKYIDIVQPRCQFRAVLADIPVEPFEPLPELIQSFRPLLGIVFDLDSYDSPLFTENEIHLVVMFALVEDLEAVNECLANQISTDSRFEDTSPCLTVSNGLLECQRTVYHLQRIVANLLFRYTRLTACRINTEFLKSNKPLSPSKLICLSKVAVLSASCSEPNFVQRKQFPGIGDSQLECQTEQRRFADRGVHQNVLIDGHGSFI